MTDHLVRPHGGNYLRPLKISPESCVSELARAKSLSQIRLTSREFGDLVMLAIGGFTPLTGFMGSSDWRGVCDDMRTADGLFWPIPITASVSPEVADHIKIGSDVALLAPAGDEIVGILTVTEAYRIDKAHECRCVFRTTDSAHPGVRMVMEQAEVNLAGPVKVLSLGEFPARYQQLFLTPFQTRVLFNELGWQRVAAFQTRNPMHRSHEYLVKIAIEICDGVLIHSLLGNLKPGDIPAEVRTKAINELVAKYFVKASVIHAGYPLDMRYAGPREALLHALFRQNYGCSHLIVGRDHAGVGDYYGPFDAQKIFDEIAPTDLEIKPLKIDWTFWCYRCGGMASGRTCPHDPSDRLLLSGTKLRKMLSDNSTVPGEFTRPEVLEILRTYYAGQQDHERVAIELTGHSGR